MDSVDDAKAALSDALEGVDNPTGAARALARVARRFEPDAETSRDAFRHAATKALEPWFNSNAKPVAWALVDNAPRPEGPGRDDDFAVVEPGVLSLADVLADPQALAPPEVIVPRMAWRGRVVLYAAREKLGKSTTARAGCAAVTRGRTFLGDPATSGRVLYLALEEHLSDVARSFQTFGADPDRTFILDRAGQPFADLEAAVREVEPALVVVDTLAAFVETLGLEPGSSADWTPVMARLTRFARDADVALELLHHGTKRDGRYRDSTAIGAGVDAILEMSEGAESSLRTVRARARWRLDDYAFRMVNGEDRPRFELSSGELSLDARVLMYLERNAGASTREVRENVEGKALDISTTLTRLDREGAVNNHGPAQRHEWHPADAEPPGSAETPGTGLGTGTGSADNPHGTATEPVSGTAPVPDSRPLEPHSGNRSLEPDRLEGELEDVVGGSEEEVAP